MVSHAVYVVSFQLTMGRWRSAVELLLSPGSSLRPSVRKKTEATDTQVQQTQVLPAVRTRHTNKAVSITVFRPLTMKTT